ncbi:hypothetical protein LOD99_4902 [Oopsacas minuta]|uniref:Uncharacterized protein n=1 Tax=Oopsacas minuta TaxID=111878 RepID=A0AAV7JT68_9METZ|nr:hypothetical protein LOD99_4902 [Oopsacas minuta]
MAEATPVISNINGSHFKDLPFFINQSFLELTKPAYGKILDKSSIETLCGGCEISRDIDLAKSLSTAGGEDWSVLKGYPKSPMVLRLACCLIVWMDRGSAELCPTHHLPDMYLMNESEQKQKRILRLDQGWEVLKKFPDNWYQWPDQTKQKELTNLISQIELRGVLDLIGFRETVGSKLLIPPTREVIMQTFTALHSEGSKLSVGARAFAKHGHRDHTASWWGTCTGSEEQKNESALKIVTKILDNAAWMNIHFMVHDTGVLEARTVEGYGVRWLADGKEFRGFLEPQMEGGHEAGWIH